MLTLTNIVTTSCLGSLLLARVRGRFGDHLAEVAVNVKVSDVGDMMSLGEERLRFEVRL